MHIQYFIADRITNDLFTVSPLPYHANDKDHVFHIARLREVEHKISCKVAEVQKKRMNSKTATKIWHAV